MTLSFSSPAYGTFPASPCTSQCTVASAEGERGPLLWVRGAAPLGLALLLIGVLVVGLAGRPGVLPGSSPVARLKTTVLNTQGRGGIGSQRSIFTHANPGRTCTPGQVVERTTLATVYIYDKSSEPEVKF
eukprot:RCo049882